MFCSVFLIRSLFTVCSLFVLVSVQWGVSGAGAHEGGKKHVVMGDYR